MTELNSPGTGADKLAWTDDRVELLKKLWAEGLSASQIAGRLAHGVTRNAVIGKVHRLNLAGRAAPSPRTTGAESRVRRVPEAARSTQARPLSQPSMPRTGNTVLKQAPAPSVAPRVIALPEPKPLRLVDTTKDGKITILHLSEKTCKWPIGDPGNEDFCFCGHTPREGAPYCEYHARLAYQAPQDRNRFRRFG
jgi:GcrA cell cycle regulator